MTNRPFEDLAEYRGYLKQYLLETRAPTLAGACDYVSTRCLEVGVTPPSTKTISRLIAAMGYKKQLVKA
jgi:hypothetical protein